MQHQVLTSCSSALTLDLSLNQTYRLLPLAWKSCNKLSKIWDHVANCRQRCSLYNLGTKITLVWIQHENECLQYSFFFLPNNSTNQVVPHVNIISYTLTSEILSQETSKHVGPSNQTSIFSSATEGSTNTASGLEGVASQLQLAKWTGLLINILPDESSLSQESWEFKWFWAALPLILALKLKLASSVLITTTVPLISSPKH